MSVRSSIRIHWGLILVVAAGSMYVVGKIFPDSWVSTYGMTGVALVGGCWIAAGRVWDAQRSDSESPQRR